MLKLDDEFSVRHFYFGFFKVVHDENEDVRRNECRKCRQVRLRQLPDDGQLFLDKYVSGNSRMIENVHV